MPLINTGHTKPYGIAAAHVRFPGLQVGWEQLVVVFLLSQPVERQSSLKRESNGMK